MNNVQDAVQGLPIRWYDHGIPIDYSKPYPPIKGIDITKITIYFSVNDKIFIDQRGDDLTVEYIIWKNFPVCHMVHQNFSQNVDVAW